MISGQLESELFKAALLEEKKRKVQKIEEKRMRF